MLSGLMMDYPLTIDRILEHGNRLYPYKQVKTKLPDGSLHVYTYRDLYRRVKRLCNVLEGLGVAPGDRVGTFAWNNFQHLELYFGAPGAGAVVHTLNIRLFPGQLAYIINHAEDKVVFIDATLLPLIEKLADEIKGVEHFVLFNEPPQGGGGKSSRRSPQLRGADGRRGRGLQLARRGREPGDGALLYERNDRPPEGRTLQPPLDVPAHDRRVPGRGGRPDRERRDDAGRAAVSRHGLGSPLRGDQRRLGAGHARSAHAAGCPGRADRRGACHCRGGRAHHLERAIPRPAAEPARYLLHPRPGRRRLGDAAQPDRGVREGSWA